ncbi:MAG: hypothetical protein JWQ20_1218 [Conexibacter sp.]|nr:hypothetical protein [Conexibacter sp.]
MPTEPTIWPREDHTRAKHELLLAFFNKWVSVHSGYFTAQGGGLVRIYDGFGGPGVYAGGEPGSPRILMSALLDNPNLLERWGSVSYAFTFVEQHAERAATLEGVLRELEARARADGRWTGGISWSVTCGRYEEHVPQPVAGPSALFLFLDPFGYSQAPMTLTGELVQQPKSDTLIFLPLSFIHRFAGREGQDAALDRFFGTPGWRHVPDGPGRPDALLNLFRAQLVAAGLRWTGAFRLKPEGANQYVIVGASGHPAGYESIKEGFWAVDPRHGEGFASSRPAPAGQQTLGFEEPEPQADTSGLLQALRVFFGDRPFSVEQAVELTQTTKYLKTHLRRQTLVPAERDGLVAVDRPPGVRQFPEARGIVMRFV